MDFWQDKKVLVTGGGGFVGSHLVDLLLESGAKVRVAARNPPTKFLSHCVDKIEFVHTDLHSPEQCKRAANGADAVFQLAATVGGVGYTGLHHGSMFTENALINLNVLDAARLENVERYLLTSSICIYPRSASVPTPEAEGFVDEPERTNVGYGWSKRVAELQARFYKQQYGMKIAIVRPANAYGPRDDFNPETSHVIPAIIRKVFSGNPEIEVWGSGDQTRSFLFVKDMARGMMLAAEKHPECDPINIGTDEEIKINDLVQMIARLAGKTIQIKNDTTKPEGQVRKIPDIGKAKQILGWKPNYTLEHGLRETVEWYKQNSGNG